MGRKIKVIVIGMMVLLGIAACGKSIEEQIQEQLELGQRYLSEANYEEAIVAFQQVLELEPKNEEAYHGLASAYTELIMRNPDEKTIREGLDILEKGYEELLDELLKQALAQIYRKIIEIAEEKEDFDTVIEYYTKLILWYPEDAEKLADIYLKIDQMDQAEEVLQFNLEKAEKKERIEKKLKELEEKKKQIAKETEIKNQHLEAIYALVNYLDEHNGELNEEVQLGEEFKEAAGDLDKPIIEEYNGKYVGIYPGGYVYYGEMRGGKREGHGNWIYCRQKNGEYIYDKFDGEWKEDYPNGYGKWENVGINSTLSWPIVITKGNYMDGYEDGAMTNIHIASNGREDIMHYDTVHGKSAVIGRVYSEDGISYTEFDGSEVMGITGAMKP